MTEKRRAMYFRIAQRHIGVLMANAPHLFTEAKSNYNAVHSNNVAYIGEVLDPHPKKKYTEWLVINCAELDMRQTELALLSDVIEEYMNLKHLFPVEWRDLYHFKSIADFKAAFNQLKYDYQDAITKHRSKKIQFYVDTLQVEVVDLPNGKTALAILTEEAAYHFSRGTKWCFNSRSNDSQFIAYTHRNRHLYFIRSTTINCAIAVWGGGIVECRDERSEVYGVTDGVRDAILEHFKLKDYKCVAKISRPSVEAYQQLIENTPNHFVPYVNSISWRIHIPAVPASVDTVAQFGLEVETEIASELGNELNVEAYQRQQEEAAHLEATRTLLVEHYNSGNHDILDDLSKIIGDLTSKRIAEEIVGTIDQNTGNIVFNLGVNIPWIKLPEQDD